jgi:hypothetical protein
LKDHSQQEENNDQKKCILRWYIIRHNKQSKLSLYRYAFAKGDRKYSSCTHLTLALDVVSGQRYAPAAVTPGNELPVPIVQRAGWASELVWTQRLEENFFAGDRTLAVQSAVRHYTDRVTQAPVF